jgi:hypothetical protein
LLLDGCYECAVLFECAGNEKEAFAREASQGRRIVRFHAHAQTQHAGWLRCRLLGQHDCDHQQER